MEDETRKTKGKSTGLSVGKIIFAEKKRGKGRDQGGWQVTSEEGRE